MSVSIDLGHLRLYCPDAAVALSLSSTICLSSPDPDGLAYTTQFVTSKLTDKSAWISRGRDLRLLLTVSWDRTLAIHHLVADIRQRLTTSLRGALLWNQLHLRPSLTIEPPRHDNDLGLITIALSFANEEPRLLTSPNHRLGEDVPFTDVRPPTGIPHVGLEQVHLSIVLSREHKRIKRRRRNLHLANHHDNEEECLDSIDGDIDDLFSAEQQQVTDGWTTELSSSHLDLEADPVALIADSTNATYTHTSSSTDGAINKDTNTRIPLSNFTDDGLIIASDVNAIIRLIDVAIRLCITSLPRKLPAGIKLTETTSFKRLDDICPALWSPGYLSAVASRSVFIPTISHAMSHLLRERAQSSSLTAKLGDLARQESLSDVHTSKMVRDDSVQRAIRIRLWRSMQRHLHDSASAKGLEALRITAAVREGLDYELETDLEHSFEIPRVRASNGMDLWDEDLTYCDAEQDYPN